MIKAHGRRADGTNIVILGLSRETCRRLVAGQPIPVDVGPFGIEAQALLCAGETEKDIVSERQKHVDLPPVEDGKSADEPS